MSHYFVTPDQPGPRHQISATIWGRDYTFSATGGVFSARRLDPGTSILFRLAPPPQDRPARFLDLGCGFGPIAVALARQCPSGRVDAVDVNHLALSLTAENAALHGVGDRVRALHSSQAWDGIAYDEIWSNPPIRIGKTALHNLLITWLARLSPEGHATLVVAKNLGADSLASWLVSRGWHSARLGSSKGFRVLRIDANPDLLDQTTGVKTALPPPFPTSDQF